MQLDLARIHGPVARIERTYQPAELDTRDDTFRVVSPIALQLAVEKRDDQYQLHGTVETTLSLDCSRCLEPFDWPVSATFDLRLIPRADQRRVEDDEARIEEDDVDTSYYDEPVIDLATVLREQFYLALPMKALCRVDCQGLCPVCGINRNTGTCSCTNEWEDPRLAPLRELRDRDDA
ncbi:MAG: DUF177 domain-containing protein [Vicinamibacteraceae bacterium]|nr:DUF177 domain-containing protein [Vicinamibacteraceae bacterium]